MSTYDLLGIPDALGVTLFVLFLALSAAPYFPGTDVGPVKIPKIENAHRRRQLQIVGPLLLFLSAALFFPVWGGTDKAPASYSLEFSDLTLERAVAYLDSLAPEVNIALDSEIAPDKLRHFSINLSNATLAEVLDAYCANAAADGYALSWRREGKNVILAGRDSD